MADTPPPNNVGSADAPENFPGFDYLERLSGAAQNAIVAHGRAMTDAWNLMRGGKWDVATAANTWAKIVDNYTPVVEEIWRVTNTPRPPAWKVIPITLGESAVSYDIRLNQSVQAGATL